MDRDSFNGRGKILGLDVVTDPRNDPRKAKCMVFYCALENKTRESTANFLHYKYYATPEDMWKISADAIEEMFGKKFYDMFMTQGGKWPAKAKLLNWLKDTGIVLACFMFSFIFKLR